MQHFHVSRPPVTVTAVELAAYFGIGRRAISDLESRGLLVRAEDGNNFQLQASTKLYVGHLRETASRRAGGSNSLTAERQRLVAAQADREETRNRAMRRELLAADQVAFAWGTILRDLRAGLLAVPSRIGQHLSHLSVHDLATIDREIRGTLASLGDDEL